MLLYVAGLELLSYKCLSLMSIEPEDPAVMVCVCVCDIKTRPKATLNPWPISSNQVHRIGALYCEMLTEVLSDNIDLLTRSIVPL